MEAHAAWEAASAGYQTVRDWVATQAESGGLKGWQAPTRLPGWRVSDLCAHLALTLRTVEEVQPAARGARASTLAQYVASYPDDDGTTDASARHEVGGSDRLPADVVVAFDNALTSAAEHLITLSDRLPRSGAVQIRGSTLRLGDFLATRCIEAAVHTRDLAHAVGDPPIVDVPRPTLKSSCRALLDVLAENVPGHAVEVRVAPFAAVQCFEGPRHTRGTPPNVVEMAPGTWLDLAAGRLTWQDALTDASVSASGARADLSSALPLL